ncbi:MAG: N-acetyl-gamma-glutamyl-phosphate reductase [Planctomycetaceae bacterium]|nr:N-acetyl-gamma-glutamyl-phosphate reductase [Planctomycetaceae bacterium]
MAAAPAKTRVAIVGATGYTAYELCRILLWHPHVEITVATTRQEDEPVLSEIHPSLRHLLDLNCTVLDPADLAQKADVVFTCLPHTASMAVIPTLLSEGLKVIDLSADYRLTDPEVYETWYGHVHTDPTRLGVVSYGLPELYRDRIKGQSLIANPGCYTSTSILGLAPLLAARKIEPKGICIDGKSGVSGAGRSPKMNTLYPECNESVSPYSVGNHRHTPEIDQVLTEISQQSVETIFTPHLIPMDRGLMCSIYARPTGACTQQELLTIMREFYAKEPFIRVIDALPRTRDVADTNFCDMTVRVSRGIVQVFSCLDNLIKGASGVAVQNFNLICGYEETLGLLPQK